jgi:uncharacterized phage protein (TIGR02218 family)
VKNIGSNLKTSLADSPTNMVRCFKIKPKDGDTLAFTEYHAELKIGDIVYKPQCNFEEGDELRAFSDITSNSYGVIAAFDNVGIRKNEIFLGKFDSARVDIFMVDCEHLEYGSVSIVSGFVDSVEISGERVYFSVAGIMSVLEKTMGSVYSPLCRAKFCDRKCGLTIQSYSHHGEIASVTGDSEFHSEVSAIKDKDRDYFRYGFVTFTEGKNVSISIEVKQSYLGNIVLNVPPPSAMGVGDQFTLVTGCDKKFSSCIEKFGNAVNFRGEPNLPRTTKVYKFY